MTFKDIKVHVDNDSACSKRLEISINLAASFKAHLTCVYVRQSFPFPAYSNGKTSADVLEAYNKGLDEQESKCSALFDEVIHQHDTTVTWRSLTGSLSFELVNETRYSDLLVLGQPSLDDGLTLNDGVADEIIVSAGRPCLIIPHECNCIEFGRSPLIAWDGSREASRAIQGALPLLKQADKITVLIVEPEKLNTAFGDEPDVMISEYLARHGLNITVEISRGSLQNIGDTILTHAYAYGHDLIVMGAFGNARWHEIMLDGATRTIMKSAKMPVLMSH